MVVSVCDSCGALFHSGMAPLRELWPLLPAALVIRFFLSSLSWVSNHGQETSTHAACFAACGLQYPQRW